MKTNRHKIDDRALAAVEGPAWLDTLEEIVAEIAPFVVEAATNHATTDVVLERLRTAARRAVLENRLPRRGSASGLLRRTRMKCDKFVAELLVAASDDNKKAAARRLRVTTRSLSERMRAAKVSVKAKPRDDDRSVS